MASSGSKVLRCADCEGVITDSAFCAGCSKHLGFCCASISENGYRRLGADRKAAWRCAKCKISIASSSGKLPFSPNPASSNTNVSTNPDNAAGSPVPASLDTILKEILDMKRHVASLPALIADVNTMKAEISELQSSCEFNHASIADQKTKIAKIEKNVGEIQSLRDELEVAKAEIAALKSDLAEKDQRSRLNNIEVKGVPEKKAENLYSVFDRVAKAVGCEVPVTQINYIARVPTHNSKEKSIIVSLNNRYVKENFIAAARARKEILASSIPGFEGTNRIFINDHLTPFNKRLLTLTKAAAKDKNYSYVWVKHSKIHVRKNDTSKVFIVTKESDLNKIV